MAAISQVKSRAWRTLADPQATFGKSTQELTQFYDKMRSRLSLHTFLRPHPAESWALAQANRANSRAVCELSYLPEVSPGQTHRTVGATRPCSGISCLQNGHPTTLSSHPNSARKLAPRIYLQSKTSAFRLSLPGPHELMVQFSGCRKGSDYISSTPIHHVG